MRISRKEKLILRIKEREGSKRTARENDVEKRENRKQNRR